MTLKEIYHFLDYPEQFYDPSGMPGPLQQKITSLDEVLKGT